MLDGGGAVNFLEESEKKSPILQHLTVRAFAAALELGGNTIRLLSVLIRPVNLKGDRNVMQYIRPVDWHGSISLL